MLVVGTQQHPIGIQMTHFQRAQNYYGCQHTNTSSINKPHAQKTIRTEKPVYIFKTIKIQSLCF